MRPYEVKAVSSAPARQSRILGSDFGFPSLTCLTWASMNMEFAKGSGLNPHSGAPADHTPVDRDHADRTAALFRAEYESLVHYLVARTQSYDEAREVASEAFAKVLAKDDAQAISFLRGYV